MKILKRGDDETVDRLSSLPESLIFEILSFLETRDVVRTSLLSKGWKDLWTTIPYLHFNELGLDHDFDPVRARNFINGVLWRWRGTKIIRLKISLLFFPSEIPLVNDMALWVGFATKSNVEDLDLQSPSCSGVEAPECLYSCTSITKLRLSGYSFPTKRGINVKWDRLKSLEILVEFMSVELLHQLVSSAPQLQVLDAGLNEIRDDICIRSSCLKRLTLRAYITPPGNTTRLTIWAPNLEELSLLRFKYSTRLLLDAPALNDVSLRLYDNGGVQVEEAFKQLLQPIQHVEALTLPISNYKKLGLMKSKCLCSNVKILKLIGGYNIQPSDIGCPADLFPKVEKLVIVPFISSKSRVTLFRRHDFGEKHREEASNPNSFLLQLRRVEVIWCPSEGSDLTYIFIKRLLKDVAMVQKIVFIKKVENYELESEEITQKMMSLRSSFPALDMIFS